jgi:hypothetical protein
MAVPSLPIFRLRGANVCQTHRKRLEAFIEAIFFSINALFYNLKLYRYFWPGDSVPVIWCRMLLGLDRVAEQALFLSLSFGLTERCMLRILISILAFLLSLFSNTNSKSTIPSPSRHVEFPRRAGPDAAFCLLRMEYQCVLQVNNSRTMLSPEVT